jgi:hypothetical protein
MMVSIEEGSGSVIGWPDCDLHLGRQMQGGHALLKDIQGALGFLAVSTNQSCPTSRNGDLTRECMCHWQIMMQIRNVALKMVEIVR